MKNSWRTRNKYTIYFNILIKSLYLPPTSTQELIRLYLSCKTIKQNNHEDKTFTWSTTVISLYNYFFSCGNNDEKRYILYPSKKSITNDLC